MAVISGRYGGVSTTDSSTGTLSTMKSWTLNYKADLYDSTNFDDSTGGRSYVSGFTGWSGTFEGFFASTGNVMVPGNSRNIVFRTSSGTSTVGVFRGDTIITGMDVGVSVDGLVTQAYTFQGTGALATSTA